MSTIHPSESASPVLHSKFIKIYFQPLDTHRKPSCLNQSFQKVFLLLFKYSCLHFPSTSLPCPTHPTSHTQSCPSLALPFPFIYALCAVTMSIFTVCYSVFPNMFVIVSMCPEEPLCLPSGRLLVPQMGLM